MKWVVESSLTAITQQSRKTICDKRIMNPLSKASPIDRQTSRNREEDDLLGDESPPLESSRKVAIFLLHRVTAIEDDSTTHFIDL
ncbi:unnamed protein product [Spirodela intermedia]|uniref:Uncharacterized protein n=2 Tax=Spirodela intermedia TaxID=51605 RepID=A0A7I8KBJ8_SPIIN|nr:unnamed protein product [Spirodela intermedia]CAA6658261.1 unnamed protein product [Spirodela intermedia]CAA7394448.1 unnamed protein product [Spirodela intermedia]